MYILVASRRASHAFSGLPPDRQYTYICSVLHQWAPSVPVQRGGAALRAVTDMAGVDSVNRDRARYSEPTSQKNQMKPHPIVHTVSLVEARKRYNRMHSHSTFDLRPSTFDIQLSPTLVPRPPSRAPRPPSPSPTRPSQLSRCLLLVVRRIKSH